MQMQIDPLPPRKTAAMTGRLGSNGTTSGLGRPRRLLGWAHLWIGIALLLPFILLGITGSILVYGEAIDHVLGDLPRATAVGDRQPLEAILAVGQAAAAKASGKADLVPDRIALPLALGDPAVIGLNSATRKPGRGAAFQVMIDPVSLEVLQSAAPQQGWLRIIHNLHGNLLISGRIGRATIGWIGVALSAMALSGLYLWWPRGGTWRRAMTIKPGARGFRLHRDLHNVTGFWSLPVFLLVLLSGVYLCFPQTIGDGLRAMLPGGDTRSGSVTPRVTPQVDTPRITLDQATALALGAAEGRQVAMIYLPARPDQPLRLTLVRPGDRLEVPNMSVFLDPWTGKVIKLQDPKDFILSETILAWLRPLHYGLGVGPVYQALVFLSGLIIPLFAVTGLSMWWIKRRNRRRARPTAQSRPVASPSSQAMKESTAGTD